MKVKNLLTPSLWVEAVAKGVDQAISLSAQRTHLISHLYLDSLSKSKGGSLLLTEPSSCPCGKVIPIENLFSILDQTINYKKTVTKDTATGVLNTASISPLNPSQGGGYPDDNPKTQFGMRKIPLEYVPPSAIHALARAFADGGRKYGPYNWREKTISSSVYYGAALRHIMAWWDGEDAASDSGLSHLDHALACLAMIVDGQSVGKLNDNRPPKGTAGKMQKDWLEKDGKGTAGT